MGSAAVRRPLPRVTVPEEPMAETMQHLSALADEIGPRPATSDAESRAASYIESVFVARGLEPEVQEFDAPRSYSWAYVLYHLLSITAAVCAGLSVMGVHLLWPAFALSAIVAFTLWMDLDTRWGLTRIMPKGPSQNVIARHIPKQRRGEKLKKVVIVAHYDSARASLAFAPGVVGQFPTTFALMKAATFAIPVVLLIDGMPLPGPAALHTYLWYLAIFFAAYLLIPLFIDIHREIAMPFVDGANDNASGVTAMLGVLHNLVTEPESGRFVTSQFPPVRRGPEAAIDAGVVPEGSLLTYTPVGGRDAATELPDDFQWVDPETEHQRAPQRGQGLLEFDTIEFGAVGEGARSSRSSEPRPEPAPAPRPPRAPREEIVSDWGSDEPLPGSGAPQGPAAMEPVPLDHADRPKRAGLLSGLGGKKEEPEDDADMKGWLGVDDQFDARSAGREIGTWDKFKDHDPDDDDHAGGLGWKGGWAGDDPIGDDDFAANEAARIRRRVTESSDRDLTEKEVWFVATGAEEVGTWGMQAFLDVYGEELRDALIINLDNVGAGQLSWVTSEGMARRYRANQRLIGLAKRVSREQEILVKPRVFKGLSTDATPALARGFKALTLMGFSSAGVPVNWHWKTDTTDNVEEEVVDRVTDLVTNMIREA
jgi:hypothetical protein